MKKLCLFISIISFTLLMSKGASAQDNTVITAGASIVAEPVMRVFPNPNPGDEARIIFEGFKADDLLVVVYDMLGREMYSKIQVEERGGYLFSFDPALAPGVYLIIASANDIVYKQKLVVK